MSLFKNQDSDNFMVVGIGASAGSLEALEQFFNHTPLDIGMAFVIIQHLSPEHKSVLADIIQKHTRMQVLTIKTGLSLKPGCVYVIPPKNFVFIENANFKLISYEQMRETTQSLPVDLFFSSLADNFESRAAGIILSGNGTDGSLGIESIKEKYGMVIAQDPSTAKFEGMPQSVIETGLADYILSPDKMPDKLMEYRRNLALQKDETNFSELFLPRIFQILKNRLGHDFIYYKDTTIIRRIKRQMAINGLDEIEEYINILETSHQMVETLFKEMLIGVTSFFRDREAFEILEKKVIPALLKNRNADNPVRVWIPACSTGEEAYSIAMLLKENQEQLGENIDFKIFATDINYRSLDIARKGIYPEKITENITAERLDRFFEKNGESYKISKEIREMIIFSEQNIIKDPPFSKMDLISCRNVMIYLGHEAQKKVISMFYYSLNPKGFLFLGNVENLWGFSSFFTEIDKKWKIFQCGSDKKIAKFISEMNFEKFKKKNSQDKNSLETIKKEMSLKDVAEKTLLKEYSPSAAIVNEKFEIIYTHGKTGKYLEPPVGDASLNILQMAREGLKIPLSIALKEAAIKKKRIILEGIDIKTNSHFEKTDITIAPLAMDIEPQPLMIIFEKSGAIASELPNKPVAEFEEEKLKYISKLEEELHSTKECLQEITEELDASNEELKLANEELLSSNEELQSSNEELETSKEELQSMNQELLSVNNELQSKNAELVKAGDDLNNLFNNTRIGVLFTDMELNIRRFTPALTEIINLIPGDIGRPLAHTVNNISDKFDIMKDLAKVSSSLLTLEKEIETNDGSSYLMKIMPYYTLDKRIAGFVITFSNISEIKRLSEDLKDAQERFFTFMEQNPSMAFIKDGDDHVLFTNKCFREFFKGNPTGMKTSDFLPPELAARMIEDDKKALKEGNAVIIETVASHDGKARVYETHKFRIDRENKKPLLGGMSIDITERTRIEAELVKSEERNRALLSAIPDTMFILSKERVFIDYHCPETAKELFQPEKFMNKNLREVVPPDAAKKIEGAMDFNIQTGKTGICEFDINVGGMVHWLEVRAARYGNEKIMIIVREITDRKNFEKEIKTYYDIVENMKVGLYLYRLEDVNDAESLRLIAANPYSSEGLGLKKEEIIGRKICDIFPGLRERGIPEKYANVVRNNKTIEFEDFYYGDDRVMQSCFAVKAFPLQDNSVVVLFENISEKKSHEENLKLFKTIIESSHEAIAIGDATGKLIYINPAHEKLFGRTLEEAQKLNYRDYYTPESVEILNARTSLLEHGENWEGELEAFDKSGRRFLLSENDGGVFARDGKLANCFGFMRDITLKKQAELEKETINIISRTFLYLKSIDEIYRELPAILAKNLKFPIATIELFDQKNSEMVFKGMHGIDPEMLGMRVPISETLSGIVARTGEPILEFDAMRRPEYKLKVLRDLSFRTFICVPIKTKKTVFGILALADTAKRQEMEFVFHLLQIIASHIALEMERKIFESEILSARDQAESANEAKSHFLANMSHELRTPMNGIMGFANLLSVTNLSDTQKEFLEIIQLSSSHLLELINDILDFSKIEAGKLKLEKVPVNAAEITRKTVEMLSELATVKNISISCDYSSADFNILGDGLRLKQIITNLLTNAIKFTNKGNVSVSVKERERIGNISILKFCFTDTGIGIDEKNIPEIFERFHQIDDSSTKRHAGAGLGLAIVKGLVDMMEGKITVNSAIGGGSCFTVEIPFEISETIPNGLVHRKKTGDNRDIEKIKVLLAEDDRISQLLIKTISEEYGWDVRIARNGIEAMDYFQSEKFDIILMDGQMPEMDGFETTIAIRKMEISTSRKRTPIIAMTAYVMPEDRQKCISSGMDDYVSKPVDPDEFIDKIKKILG